MKILTDSQGKEKTEDEVMEEIKTTLQELSKNELIDIILNDSDVFDLAYLAKDDRTGEWY